MDTEKAKVIDINDYRESKLDNEDLKEDNKEESKVKKRVL